MYRSQGALGEYFAAQGMGEYFAAKGMGEYFSGTGGALVDWAKQEEREHGIGEYFSGVGEYFAQNGLGDEAVDPEVKQNLNDIAVCETLPYVMNAPAGQHDQILAECVGQRRRARALEASSRQSAVVTGLVGAAVLYGIGKLTKSKSAAVWALCGAGAGAIVGYKYRLIG